MNSKRSGLRDVFFAEFSFCLSDEFTKEVAVRTGIPEKDVAQGVAGYMNEAIFAYEMISPHISKRKRILEIGPGIPFLALFLFKKGYNIEVIDYQTGAFAPLSIASKMVLSHFSSRPAVLNLDISGNKLPNKKYDLIFSLNVLEHIDNIEGAYKNMEGLLSVTGVMIHSCPNYSIPYEPHFGLPLLPFSSKANRYIYSREIKKNEALWESLNFITYRKVRALTIQNGLDIRFQKGVMYKHLKRLLNDKQFQARHKVIYIFATFLFSLGLAKIFRRIPPRLSTPMTFVAVKRPAN